MPDNEMLQRLIYLGLTEYEARAYVALVRKNPATAYETARNAGISTSKVYGVLSRLKERGIVDTVEQEGKDLYVPQPPEEFLALRRRMTEHTLSELDRDFLQLGATRAHDSHVWNVVNYDVLSDKSARMIREARKYLVLSLWPDEAFALHDLLQEALARGVSIASIHFGPQQGSTPVPGMCFMHPIQDTLYAEKGGRGFVLVADGSEALVATISNDLGVEGAFSRADGFVSLAEDYLKHDIYMMKVVRRFDRQLRSTFGGRYELMRDIFSDGDAL